MTGLARGLFGKIAPAQIAAHLLSVTADGDWAVRRAALQALARRYRFAVRDELVVSQRPRGRAVLGTYGTTNRVKPEKGSARKGGRRPYVTALLGLSPLRTSCGCADFVRSSLGLCKHGLVVLDTLAHEGVLGERVRAKEPTRSVLRWAPEQPLSGAPDRLARLSYQHLGTHKPLPMLRDGAPDPELLRDPRRRLAWIETLEKKLDDTELEVEPAVRTLLCEERERAKVRTQDAGQVRAALKSLSKLSRKLYGYQLEGVRRFFETGRLLLADDIGLGKTTQAIAACHGLHATGQAKRGLLIVPNALKPQWKREWEATSNVVLTLLEGSASQRKDVYRRTTDGFILVGYEQFVRDLEWAQAFAPDLVVLDEAQRIKNWATKSAAYVKALSPAYRLVLTGTPLENRLDELASIMDFVDDIALEPKWRLSAFHGVQAEGSAALSGAKNLDVLRDRLATSMLRRVRKDVLLQLPARCDTRVPVEMTEVQRDAHDELRRPIAELAGRAAKRPLSPREFTRLMQLLTTQRMICNGMTQLRFDEEWPRFSPQRPTAALLEGLFAPKLSALRTLIEQIAIGQQRKVVVFSQWRNMLRSAEWAIRDLLEAEGKRAAFFTGAESSALRERAVVAFHEDPSVSVLFLSDAGGVGLNLQRAASCCINLELPWNPAVLEQRVGRIYRLGQERPIDVYNLVSEEGIEGRIATLIGNKRALFDAVFDGTSDAVAFDGQSSFMHNVQKLVEPVEATLDTGVALEDDTALDELVLPTSESLGPLEGAHTSVASPVLASTEDRAPPAPARAAPALDLSGLTIERRADGGLRIEASPALAGPLADLLESLARSLRQSAERAAE